MKAAKFLACLLPLLAGAVHAQDDRSIKSPDGQVEFRLFTSLPQGSIFNCLSYQVWWHGKPVLETSYLGLNIHFQEPYLGENVGLSSDKPIHEAHYNGLWADYMQVSTTGKRVYFEVRVWNDGVAFRYTIPPSWLLFDLQLEDDATQYRFDRVLPGSLPDKAESYEREVPALGWVGIYQQQLTTLPKMQLVRFDDHTLATHIPDSPKNPGVVFEGKTPWTSPWHIVALGQDREKLPQSEAVRESLR